MGAYGATDLFAKLSSFLKWSAHQLPNRDADKDAQDIIILTELLSPGSEMVCAIPSWGAAPLSSQERAPTLAPDTRHSSQKQVLRAWWVSFKQKNKAQVIWEQMPGSSIFTLSPYSLVLPRGSQKEGQLLQCLQSCRGPDPPPHSSGFTSGKKNYTKLFSIGKACILILLTLLIIKSNV